MQSDFIIEIKNLTKVYNGSVVPAVDNLSFSVKKGEIFGLLGPNGAGKTTTISTLTSVLKPTEGDIKINNLDLLVHLNEIKKQIGVVGQDIALYDKLTANENLLYFGSLYGIPKKQLKTKINSLLKRLGLYDYGDVLLTKFSGGMKRRINLLVGVLHQPSLLFLDEPTVGIDVQNRNVIREFLLELKEKGTTIIYSSHLMEDIQLLCDRIMIIDHGKLVCEGNPKHLISAYENCNSLEDVFLELTGRKLRD